MQSGCLHRADCELLPSFEDDMLDRNERPNIYYFVITWCQGTASERRWPCALGHGIASLDKSCDSVGRHAFLVRSTVYSSYHRSDSTRACPGEGAPLAGAGDHAASVLK
jgi:hypothetical protein